MELKEFIISATKETINAISELQDEYSTIDAIRYAPIISPSDINNDDTCEYNNIRRKVSYIDFDIALTVSEQTKEGGIAGLNIKIFRGEKDESIHSENTAIQKIKFRIPVALPALKTENMITKGVKLR
ncbi:MAG: hypothetical protein U0M63_01020 [Alistipes onderdonkii]|jgi:hypothetical protein|nr:hypothetical protein [Alistipes onderdonkii]MEE0848234.1 hypothetical protein [Alistipes onderdonkii]